MPLESRANMYHSWLDILNIAWLADFLVQDVVTYFTFGLNSVRKLNKDIFVFVASLILNKIEDESVC